MYESYPQLEKEERKVKLKLIKKKHRTMVKTVESIETLKEEMSIVEEDINKVSVGMNDKVNRLVAETNNTLINMKKLLYGKTSETSFANIKKRIKESYLVMRNLKIDEKKKKESKQVVVELKGSYDFDEHFAVLKSQESDKFEEEKSVKKGVKRMKTKKLKKQQIEPAHSHLTSIGETVGMTERNLGSMGTTFYKKEKTVLKRKVCSKLIIKDCKQMSEQFGSMRKLIRSNLSEVYRKSNL